MKTNVFYLLTLMCLILFVQVKAQKAPKWEETRDWKLYAIQDNRAFRYSLDTLKNFSSTDIDLGAIKPIIKGITAYSSDDKPLWMGYYVVTFKDAASKVYKAEVSMYGGFLYLDMDKQYYFVPEDSRGQWQEQMKLAANKFNGSL